MGKNTYTVKYKEHSTNTDDKWMKQAFDEMIDCFNADYFIAHTCCYFLLIERVLKNGLKRYKEKNPNKIITYRHHRSKKKMQIKVAKMDLDGGLALIVSYCSGCNFITKSIRDDINNEVKNNRNHLFHADFENVLQSESKKEAEKNLIGAVNLFIRTHDCIAHNV